MGRWVAGSGVSVRKGIKKGYAYGLVVAADFRKAVHADRRQHQRDEGVSKAPASWC